MHKTISKHRRRKEEEEPTAEEVLLPNALQICVVPQACVEERYGSRNVDFDLDRDSYIEQQQQQHTSYSRCIRVTQTDAAEMPLSQGNAPCRIRNNNTSNDNSKGNNAATANKRRLLAACATDAKRKARCENLQLRRTQQQPHIGIAAGGRSSSSSNSSRSELQLSYLLGESLARCGRLLEAFDVYAIIAHDYLDGCVPLERLNVLATGLIDQLRSAQAQKRHGVDLNFGHAKAAASTGSSQKQEATCEFAALELDSEGYLDPLLCPLCQDILRCPVTTNCGHTFCRQCCEAITGCHICKVKFPRSNFDDGALTQCTPISSSNRATATTGADAAVAVVAPHSCALNATSYSSNVLSGLRSSTAAAARMTVTTAAVASTTATATTTMASSTTSAPFSMRSLAAGSVDNMKFMPDVLVRRLVEKWWGAELQTRKINETAASYMHLNLLDEALKFCNASLEKSHSNFKSLLLRAEVLRKLNHFQSSLSDIDNLLKMRYSSAKAHYQRSLTLYELGRLDEALQHSCLAIGLDNSANLSATELFKHDLAKLLQKLLAQVPKRAPPLNERTVLACRAPYSIFSEQRTRRKQIGLLSNVNDDYMSSPLHRLETDKRFEELLAAEALEQALVGVVCGKSPETIALNSNLCMEYQPTLQRPQSRKHCRRKWAKQDTELMPRGTEYDGRCGEIFRHILGRTQQELLRLKKLQSNREEEQQLQMPVLPSLIDASDFDCVLCCRTFWKPVVTPCGHTYCWVCLDRCMDYTSSCPLCMSPLVEPFNINAYPPGPSSPVPFVLAKRPVTKFLEAAMKRFIPDSYARRFHQEMDLEPSVPVFICTAAFPHVPCPLFVYEPRYRLMVRRAVESGDKQFGIVQPHSGKSRYFDVGTILDIRDCVLLGDGCSILSTVGCKRFRILGRNEKDGYETAKVEYICDEPIAHAQLSHVANMLGAVLLKASTWIDSLNGSLRQEILQSFGAMPALEDNWQCLADGPAWAWWIIALLPLSQQLKVDILATTSLEKRLRAIEKTLDYLSGSFRRSAQQSCSVVVQQQQQQQQQQGQQDCDSDLLSEFQSQECCLRTAATAVALVSNGDAHAHSAEQHTHLLL